MNKSEIKSTKQKCDVCKEEFYATRPHHILKMVQDNTHRLITLQRNTFCSLHCTQEFLNALEKTKEKRKGICYMCNKVLEITSDTRSVFYPDINQNIYFCSKGCYFIFEKM